MMLFTTFVKNAQVLLLPILVALVTLPLSVDADWQVTQYLAVGAVKSLSAYTGYYYTTQPVSPFARVTVYSTTTYTYSYSSTFLLSASPTAPSVDPTRTSTSTNSYEHVTYTKYYLPLSAFPDPSALPTQSDEEDYYGTGTTAITRTIWIEARLSTAPSFCTKQWTYTDESTVYPPSAVYPQLKPTSSYDSTTTKTATSPIYLTRPDGAYEYETSVLHTTTVFAYRYLSPDTVPTTTTVAQEDLKSWYNSVYGEATGASRYTSYLCSNPSPYQTSRATATAGTRNYSGSSSKLPTSDKTGDERTEEILAWLKQSGSFDYYTDDQLRRIAEQMQYPSWAAWMWSRKEVKAGVIAAAVVFVVLLLGGFVESFLWFGRLMTGKSALRGGTISWTIATIWAVCLVRREKAVQDEDRRTEMALRWKEMGMGDKIKLWKKYGMKWRYPVDVLGAREGAGVGGKKVPVVTVTEVSQARGAPVPMASVSEDEVPAPAVVPVATGSPGNPSTSSASHPPAAAGDTATR